ncbi:MAG: hypothetical protein JWO70_4053 [Betaproteobacteria bacterium]|jgi:hypothetical protein|nr:hypothetical protein [Betaproteobacteria bacterium]
MEQNAQTCAHRPCKCSVTEGQKFCSNHCERQSKGDEAQKVVCGCGHPECGGTEAAA